MIIYDYLFYKGYQLAKRLKNWEDTPKLFASMIVLSCAMLNFASLLFIAEGLNRRDLGFGTFISILNEFKYISGGIVALLIWWYYSYKGRWKRIVTKYENRENEQGKSIHPVIIIVIAYILSLVFIDISSMYRNEDGTFW